MGWFKNFSLVFMILVALTGISTSHAEEEGEAPGLVQYIEMKPSFVLTYGPPSPKLAYAKVDISLRVDSRAAEEAVEHHMPALRNTIVMLFSQQTDDIMSNQQGREKLRNDALAALQKQMEEEVGQPTVGDLLFTNFVVQK